MFVVFLIAVNLGLAGYLFGRISSPASHLLEWLSNISQSAHWPIQPTQPQGNAISSVKQVVMALAKQLQSQNEILQIFSKTLDSRRESIFVLDKQGRIRFFNRSAGELIGYESKQLDGADFRQVLDSPLSLTQLLDLNIPLTEFRLLRKDGTAIPVVCRRARSGQGDLILTIEVETRHDFSGDDKEIAAALFEKSPQCIIITDARGKVMSCNPVTTQTMGYRPEQLQDRTLTALWLADNPMSLNEFISRLKHKQYLEAELRLKCKDGSREPFWLTAIAVKAADGAPRHFVLFLSNLSERHAAEQKIHQLSFYDTLTRLPNRHLFLERLQLALIAAGREHRKLAVLYLDLDRFKVINDSSGHGAGDALLQAVAKRLASSVRQDDTLARLGGDEFAILLNQIKHPDEAAVVAEKLLVSLCQGFSVEGAQCFTSASIGISIYPDDASNSEQLLKHADSAMYQAKRKGRNRYQFFSPDSNAMLAEQLALEHELRLALERDALQLYFQPQWHLQTGRIIGVEALLRWQHPKRGWVPPQVFVPLADDCGLGEILGEWVLRNACLQMFEWQQRTGIRCNIAVNISAKQIQNPALVRRIDAILKETSLAPDFLELELAETALMENETESSALVVQLHGLNVHMTVDHFGTGKSSLNCLKRFGLQRLKIDRSLIAGVTDHSHDAVIVEAIIALGRSLDMSVIAVGVENQAQADFLRQRQCLLAQGWLLSQPLEATAVEKLIHQYGSTHAPVNQL